MPRFVTFIVFFYYRIWSEVYFPAIVGKNSNSYFNYKITLAAKLCSKHTLYLIKAALGAMLLNLEIEKV